MATASDPQLADQATDACVSADIADVAALTDEQLAAVTKALGHPLRVRILRMLTERQTCMTGELVAELPVAQSTVSEHLRILRAAGLIQGEIEGPRTAYCVNRVTLAALKQTVAAL
jgi:ArsR family transcriptional regulator, arsenate/arsenite/antimonite-responsive transcriptional repressor